VSVNVMVHAGFQLSSISRDKFLVMGMPIDSGDISNQELTDLWKVPACFIYYCYSTQKNEQKVTCKC